LRLVLWRWHRRIGLLVALIMILLSVTGIMLNHVSSIGGLHEPVRSLWLLKAYGIEAPTPTSYAIGNRYITSLGRDYFYLDVEESAYCRGTLKGAVAHSDMIVVACGDELVLLSERGEVVERIGSAYGLPAPVENLGLCGEALCLSSKNQRYKINIDQLSWLPVSAEVSMDTSKPVKLPQKYERTLIQNYMGDSISWERVLLDLHSGHLLGFGPWLMDIAALFLIMLAISGVSMWYSGRRRKRR